VNVQIRTCQACPDTLPQRCIFVACRDAVAVGRCHYGTIDPPAACRTCDWRNTTTGGAGQGFQLCRACLQTGFAAWKLGNNVCGVPVYVPERQRP
jgi:hypothetical protein